jgi:hypothetical protein
MKITGNFRRFAAEKSLAEEEMLKNGMKGISREFTEKGSELCAKA